MIMKFPISGHMQDPSSGCKIKLGEFLLRLCHGITSNATARLHDNSQVTNKTHFVFVIIFGSMYSLSTVRHTFDLIYKIVILKAQYFELDPSLHQELRHAVQWRGLSPACSKETGSHDPWRIHSTYSVLALEKEYATFHKISAAKSTAGNKFGKLKSYKEKTRTQEDHSGSTCRETASS